MYRRKCRGRESNPHGGEPQWILSPPRLPIPPPRRKNLSKPILIEFEFLARPIILIKKIFKGWYYGWTFPLGTNKEKKSCSRR